MAQELHSTVTSTLDPPPLPPLTDQPVWPQPRVGAFWGEDMILTAAVLRDTRFENLATLFTQATAQKYSSSILYFTDLYFTDM